MFYHIKIDYYDKNLKVNQTLYEYDYSTEDEVIEKVVTPFIEEKRIVFSGTILDAEDRRQLSVYKTELNIESMVNVANQNVSPGVIYVYHNENLLINNKYSKEITKEMTQKAIAFSYGSQTTVVSHAENKVKQPKIFISHKSEDLHFVKELIRLLEFIIGTDADKIFCSSIAGYDIKPGREILSELKRQFNDYEIYFIVVHSPRYYESSICLNEMGAAWVLGNKFCSFLTADCKFTMLNGAIDGKYMSVKVDDNYDIVVSKLNSLKDELLGIFSVEKFNPTRWEAYRNEFIRNTQRIDFLSSENETTVNIGPKPTAQITTEVINTKPVMIDIMNRGDGIAENLDVRLDDACSDMIITGLDNFPLEYLKPGRHVKLSVYPCISDPRKFKISFGWEENGIPYSSEDIVIL